MSTSPPSLQRPGVIDGTLLTVAVLAAATSGPFTAAIAAPAIAVAFWRCSLAAVATAPFARGLRALSAPREARLLLLSGVFLALHFAAWLPALRLTSVATATALVATQPVWAVVIARASGARLPRRTYVGVAIAFLGVLVLTGVDVSGDPKALLGDLLATIGGFFAAAYVTTGERARQSVSTNAYNTVVYGISGVVLLAICLVGRQSLAGYSARDWVLILALTIGAQLLGHSLTNRVLRTTSATIVSLAYLFEVPGATLIAAWWLGQGVPIDLLPALLLLFTGLVIVIASATRGIPTETSPV
ncbi:MAG TPA: DMT family transporter [Candidatus Nanopelagicales bacterium]